MPGPNWLWLFDCMAAELGTPFVTPNVPLLSAGLLALPAGEVSERAAGAAIPMPVGVPALAELPVVDVPVPVGLVPAGVIVPVGLTAVGAPTPAWGAPVGLLGVATPAPTGVPPACVPGAAGFELGAPAPAAPPPAPPGYACASVDPPSESAKLTSAVALPFAIFCVVMKRFMMCPFVTCRRSSSPRAGSRARPTPSLSRGNSRSIERPSQRTVGLLFAEEVLTNVKNLSTSARASRPMRPNRCGAGRLYRGHRDGLSTRTLPLTMSGSGPVWL